jgi:ribosomal protein S18 acetylase RimI-like enzyme
MANFESVQLDEQPAGACGRQGDVASLRLRRASPEDLPFLSRLYASTREEELAPVPWSAAQKAAFLQWQFDAQHAYYTANYPEARFDVILLQDAPVGRLYVARWKDEIRIIDISLLPAYRRRGLGSALLRTLLAEGARSDRPVTIHVERENPALRLYEKLGFRRAEDRGVYWFLRWTPEPGASELPSAKEIAQ